MVERQKGDKAKTGVFTGAHCINPVNGKRIPVWIADYVLMGYGTGAIMAVPGHDERDFEFAQAFDLPIVRVIAADGETAQTPLEAAWAGDGSLVNSGEFDGLAVAEGKRAIVESLEGRGQASAQANFRLRDWCVSRQRYWGPPIPMVHCDDCGAVPLPESALPVELPHLDDFRPDDSGVSPLARDKDWYEVPCPECGEAAHRDTDVTDNFLCSGWYFLRYPSTDRDDVALDAELTRKWLPVDSYIGGNEHAVLHLMYARFITMALCDHGVLHFDEPFTRFRAHGLLIREGRKMSKSKGNVITPDQVIDGYGADTMRLYLLFLGPYEQGGDYQGRGIQGPHGFLGRLWQSVEEAEDAPPNPDVERALHRTIKQVSEQVPQLQYNTAIAAMMEYLGQVRAGGRTPSKAELEPLVIMLSPFAPHIAEELYERLGHTDGLFGTAAWPDYDPAKTVEATTEVAVQVNGKVRGAHRSRPRRHRGRRSCRRPRTAQRQPPPGRHAGPQGRSCSGPAAEPGGEPLVWLHQGGCIVNSLRPFISIYLLAVAVLVGLNMVFDSTYLGSADAIWGYLDWPINLAMLLALAASIRRLALAGVRDVPARLELVGTAFVTVVWFDVWVRKVTGGSISLATFLFVDGFLVAAMLAVGLRLRQPRSR